MNIATPFRQYIGGDAPCDGCENFSRCKEDKLACDAFYNFIDERDGGSTEPSREIYDKAFNVDA